MTNITNIFFNGLMDSSALTTRGSCVHGYLGCACPSGSYCTFNWSGIWGKSKSSEGFLGYIGVMAWALVEVVIGLVVGVEPGGNLKVPRTPLLMLVTRENMSSS